MQAAYSRGLDRVALFPNQVLVCCTPEAVYPACLSICGPAMRCDYLAYIAFKIQIFAKKLVLSDVRIERTTAKRKRPEVGREALSDDVVKDFAGQPNENGLLGHVDFDYLAGV